jgi:hypothetical protein
MAKRSNRNSDDAWLEGDADSIDSDFDSGPGEVVDLKQIGQVFGMTRYDVHECIARGAPVRRRGSKKVPWEIEAGSFAAWLVRDTIANRDTEAGRFREAQTRKTIAGAIRVEEANARVREETLTIKEARTLFREERDVLSRHLNSVPAAISAALAALTPEERRNPVAVDRVMEDAINDALRRIYNDGVEHAQAA